MRQPKLLYALLLPALLALPGCASLMASATDRLAGNLGTSILNQDDPATVQQGAPAYLLLIDGLIADDPQRESLLRSGARLYGAYAGVFVEDPERAKLLTARARDYGRRALCLRNSALCAALNRPYAEYAAALAGAGRSDVPALYDYATAWVGWIQARSADWSAVAELPGVEASLQRVVALDEGYDQGGAHLYLGVLASLRPPALGGKPDLARQHFERAIALSHGRNLMVKVEYARRYARLVFDRPLHDRLLKETLAADVHEPGLTLINTLAQKQARALLASADSYF